jgi:hypothetical protein
MATILEGRVLWSYEYEVVKRNANNDIGYQFWGTGPFYRHSGNIVLNESRIAITGDIDVLIPLGTIGQLYLGFDEVYTAMLTKNLGLFWQPLRLTLGNDVVLYLIIDYNFIGAKNKKWFLALKEMLE